MNTPAKRKRGRPPKNESRAVRPERNRLSVSDARNILTVKGKDPDFEYRWICDYDERGVRINVMTQRGYDLVDASKEDLGVGDYYVHAASDVGSIYRVPESDGSKYLFLMKIPKEWYEEDQAIREAELLGQQSDLEKSNPSMGQYGKSTISRD